MASRHRLLLIRHFGAPTGGNVKVRDYYTHAAAHPLIDAALWFSPGSRHRESDIWDGVPDAAIVSDPRADLADTRFVALNGKDWSLLPERAPSPEILHFTQHPGYLTDPVLRAYLARPARRICTTPALRNALAPAACGPMHLVPIGAADGFFARRSDSKSIGVTILSGKQPALAEALAARLRRSGLAPVLAGVPRLPQPAYETLIGATDVLVALPNIVEGFYLPALEGMAAGSVVITNDAGGNRGHCRPETTCLIAPRDDLDAHEAAVMRALSDAPLRDRLRAGGDAVASRHTMAEERRAFHTVIDVALAER
ncbi:MAG: glycosyltransferase [Sphingomonas sp.]|jgi:hypothetical protein|uniref:glycosyltransferase n=1 Tax=Sphingomonas sp. TaxID=28214 RepID=UPI003569CB5B